LQIECNIVFKCGTTSLCSHSVRVACRDCRNLHACVDAPCSAAAWAAVVPLVLCATLSQRRAISNTTNLPICQCSSVSLPRPKAKCVASLAGPAASTSLKHGSGTASVLRATSRGRATARQRNSSWKGSPVHCADQVF
jgi:hypothetical protein